MASKPGLEFRPHCCKSSATPTTVQLHLLPAMTEYYHRVYQTGGFVVSTVTSSCSFLAVYYPPEKTAVTIYDKIKQYDPFIADCSFEFVSRSQVLHDLLEKGTDPEQLLCSSVGISTVDIKQFDKAMAQKIKRKSPNDFHLLDAKFPEKVKGMF